ncbi:hypothetical protein [Ligilactobacillus ruminis]|uniref:hypothetical protein n=1 Tax=Ligilactobacillus ruminis TaxID=1623 RepID=UPI003F982A83
MDDFYGHISKITHLPVTEGRILRANLKKRHFDRNPHRNLTKLPDDLMPRHNCRHAHCI